jgi:hypothetical protein
VFDIKDGREGYSVAWCLLSALRVSPTLSWRRGREDVLGRDHDFARSTPWTKVKRPSQGG